MRACQPTLLRAVQAAALLSVSERTVRTLIASGDLEAAQAPGTSGPRGRRVTRASVEAYLGSQKRGATVRRGAGGRR